MSNHHVHDQHGPSKVKIGLAFALAGFSFGTGDGILFAADREMGAPELMGFVGWLIISVWFLAAGWRGIERRKAYAHRREVVRVREASENARRRAEYEARLSGLLGAPGSAGDSDTTVVGVLGGMPSVVGTEVQVAFGVQEMERTLGEADTQQIDTAPFRPIVEAETVAIPHFASEADRLLWAHRHGVPPEFLPRTSEVDALPVQHAGAWDR